MSSQTQQPCVNNPDYDLISTMYHALKSEQVYSDYIRDAQATGDQDLVNFFQQLRQQCDQSADQARQLLNRPIEAKGVH